MKSFGAAVLVLLVTVAVSACGDSRSPAGAPQPTDQAIITGTPAGSNADDVAFASATATSYGQASELTALVPGHSSDPNVVALAAEIAAAQVPNLETMKVFLVQWGSNSDGGPAQSAQGGAAPGTVDDATMARLTSLRGKDFDTVWLRAMIGHQQGAVALAQAELAKGVNVDAVATAKRLVGTYGTQIAKLQQLLTNG
jgi:uncharacterized protein (DUF305 family)